MNSVSHSLFLYEEAIKVIKNNIIICFFLLMSIVYVYFNVNIIINNF